MLCTVLIVDDSALTRSLERSVVRSAGVSDQRIFEASNGLEALALFEQAWIDVVLLDLTMPVMDGETFARLLRAREDLGDVRIVVVTSDRDPARHARLRRSGVDGILTKPFDAESLRAMLSRTLPASTSAAA
jgi:two-component system chemotaxis response regulator CheY